MILETRTNVRNVKITSYLFEFALDEARRRIGQEYSVREMERECFTSFVVIRSL